jgi:molecular chaperone GrpE (heat shock protein)
MKKEDVAEKIENLEGLLHSSVRHVTRFLHHQIDFSNVRKMSEEKVESKETMESQKIAKETEKLADEINRLREKSGVAIKKQPKPLPPIGFNLVNPV